MAFFFMFILLAPKFEVIVLLSLCVASTEVLHRKANDRFAISQYRSKILLFVVLILPVIGVLVMSGGRCVQQAWVSVSLGRRSHIYVTTSLRHGYVII